MTQAAGTPGPMEGIRLLETLQGHRNWVGRIAWSSDGRFLATPSSDAKVRIWDMATFECVCALPSQAGPVNSASWSRDDRLLATVGEGNWLRLWDTSKWEPTTELELSHSTVDLAFSPRDDRLLVTCGRNVLCWSEGEDLETILQFEGNATCVVWNSEGTRGASCSDRGELALWGIASNTRSVIRRTGDALYSVAFSPDGGLVASGGRDGVIRLWDPKDDGEGDRCLYELRSHEDMVRSVDFSFDGHFLASSSLDDTVRLWSTDTWRSANPVPEVASKSRVWLPGIAFHPSRPILATLGESDRNVRLWELSPEEIVGEPSPRDVRYLTAKVVLVGDSGVGKTALGQRLAKGEFKEQPSSHGQHFWILDSLRHERVDGTECEVVLWDLAGQPDYRLVHALFLDRVDIALIVFDPTQHDRPLRGVDYWLNALRLGTGRRCEVILVAARIDRGLGPLTDEEMERYCASKGIRDYVRTSAANGQGIEELVSMLERTLDWDQRQPGPTSVAFARVKQHLFAMRRQPKQGGDESPLIELEQLIDHLSALETQGRFNRRELRQAIEELAIYGHIMLLRGGEGKESVLMQPDLLGRLASSVVLLARGSEKGLGSLEERRFLKGEYDLPELARLSSEDRRIMLDAVATTFIERNLCLRETLGRDETLLIFPALINVQKPVYEDGSIAEDATYVVQGPVDRVFAALVVLLGYARTISRVDQWHKGAQYEIESADREVCGFRVLNEEEGKAEFVLYFGRTTGGATRLMFQGLFDMFLMRWDDVAFVRYPVVPCPTCSAHLDRNVVVGRLQAGKPFAFCNECGRRLELPAGRSHETNLPTTHTQVEASARSADTRTLYERALVGLKMLVTAEEKVDRSPVCYLSHAHGDASYLWWIERLDKDLRNAEIKTRLTVPRRGTTSREDPRLSEFVLLCCTPEYRLQSSEGGGLVEEWGWISQRLQSGGLAAQTVLPLLIEGDPESSFPDGLAKDAESRRVFDFRTESRNLARLFDLVLTLHQIPLDLPEVVDLRAKLRHRVDSLRGDGS